MRLIDADALSEKLCEQTIFIKDGVVFQRMINDAPTVSAEPKTGEWVLKKHLWECDQCGCRTNRANPLKGNIWNYNYCPNCGAMMVREDGEA